MSYELPINTCNRIEVSGKKLISVKIIDYLVYSLVPSGNLSFFGGVCKREVKEIRWGELAESEGLYNAMFFLGDMM